LVANCSVCGKELPGEFSFCPFCAAPLSEQPPSPPREERKVVTVLFCDLVGFTASSEAADPEDVRSRIRPYHARLRQEIERHGGTVEKFIGDAVMAVFGAPIAHEDDAERTVRAGLRILEAIAELNEADPALSLQVRIGINTGEAVVALEARPEQGEGIVTGDVVNTASRLQGAAPVNGIACSEQTYRQTERIFEYEELAPVQVKGKTDQLPLYRPLHARARFGSDVTRTHTTPLVGRELEKPLLIGIFERAAQQRSCQLVTIVGEPGVGKSRLCTELFAYIEERPELVTWRQGRCLPYGDGIAFWALGEIVKAECGILESDSPAEVEAKLERALPQGDPDFAWLKARLAPLVGAGGEPTGQEESFTAWRRCLESWADRREMVLVFEDLHWADEALLVFLEHLADWSQGVPLLLVCTARPELYEQHPAWAAGLRNATTINLAPLTDEETARLIAALLEQAVLSVETQQALIERAGGNPLYAEEFVRLLSDRHELAEAVEVPDSVQALIAARLDTLSPERKGLLQDAAVIGKVFWAGALASMAGQELRAVEVALHELARKELVRPARTTSMEDEPEYGFWHGLIREVCYSQIPRSARAARHRAAAAWLERKAGERVEDIADVLAYHYLQALDLVRLVGPPEDIEDLQEKARRYLALAAERALPLDVESAESSLAKALELAPAGHPARPRMLERWAQAAQQQYRLQEAEEAIEEALALYRERGETVAVARALCALSVLSQHAGGSLGEERVMEAIAVLEAEPPGPELVAAYAELSGVHSVHSAHTEAIEAADRALALATELGLPEPVRALGFRAKARASLGDRGGLEAMRRALLLEVEEGHGRAAAVLHNNLAFSTVEYEGPSAALSACREGIDFCERRGITEFAVMIGSMSTGFAADCGLSDEALAKAGPLAERMEAAGDLSFIEPRSVELRLLAERGERGHATTAGALAEAARKTGMAQLMVMGLAAASRVLAGEGQTKQARVMLTELAQLDHRTDVYYGENLSQLVRTALGVGDLALASRLLAGVEPKTPLFEHGFVACRAQLAEAGGNEAEAATLYAEAAGRWHGFGDVRERAYALLGQGRCLAAQDRIEAEAPLREARELFASMRYKPALVETEALLGPAKAAM
jgi:class 3 adenylate cyclase/tetratricopeptide (TPR) repeat protein